MPQSASSVPVDPRSRCALRVIRIRPANSSRIARRFQTPWPGAAQYLRYTTLSQHNFVDAARRHAYRIRQSGLADFHRAQKLFEEDFAGVNVLQFTHDHLLNGSQRSRPHRAVFRPHETDSPLIVDAEAVLPFAIIFQSFEPVGWRYFQINKRLRLVQHEQFPQRRLAEYRAASCAIPRPARFSRLLWAQIR